MARRVERNGNHDEKNTDHVRAAQDAFTEQYPPYTSENDISPAVQKIAAHVRFLGKTGNKGACTMRMHVPTLLDAEQEAKRIAAGASCPSSAQAQAQAATVLLREKKCVMSKPYLNVDTMKDLICKTVVRMVEETKSNDVLQWARKLASNPAIRDEFMASTNEEIRQWKEEHTVYGRCLTIAKVPVRQPRKKRLDQEIKQAEETQANDDQQDDDTCEEELGEPGEPGESEETEDDLHEDPVISDS